MKTTLSGSFVLALAMAPALAAAACEVTATAATAASRVHRMSTEHRCRG